MVQTNHISPKQIERILSNQLNDHEVAVCESHLQDCDACQASLAKLAGNETWWKKTRSHLSTTEIPLPKWEDESDSIFIPLDSDPEPSVNSSDSLSSAARSVLDEPTHPEMLGRIGDFDVEEVIGQGGMGVVYKAYDQDLKRAVAIKVLAPHLAANGVARKRFAREAQAAAAVVHPNVVPIYSVNTSDRPFIVMALASGRSLHDLVVNHGPQEPKVIVRIAKQIAAGLAAAHRHGLIHRDIKPANILLERDVSRVMITDFGLARATDDVAVTQTGWLAGTPHYMSPEQAMGEDLDAKSDLFSLGSVIYFLATGREPFRAEKPFAILQKIIAKTPMSANRLNSEIPETLSRIISRLLEKRPHDRFDSAASLESILERYLAHLQNPTRDSKPRIVSKRQRRFLQRTFAAIVSLVVVCSVILVLGMPAKTTNREEGFSSTNNKNAVVPPSNLQPFNEWVEDLRELDDRISEFERGTAPSRRDASNADTLSIELQRLDREINALEKTDSPFFLSGEIE